jgi:hypothetical protein
MGEKTKKYVNLELTKEVKFDVLIVVETDLEVRDMQEGVSFMPLGYDHDAWATWLDEYTGEPNTSHQYEITGVCETRGEDEGGGLTEDDRRNAVPMLVEPLEDAS